MKDKLITPFTHHWKDLQIKLFYSLGSYIVTFLICFQYRINLFYFIASYFIFLKKTFIFTHLSSGFWAYLHLVFWTSNFFIAPLVIYLCFFFFLKSLFNFQIKITFWSLNSLFAIFFFIIKFACFKLLPLILSFFINFENHTGPLLITLEARLDQYLDFFLNFIFLILLVLLVPSVTLIFLILVKKSYKKHSLRKYMYVVSLLIFLVFSPPDLMLQLTFCLFIALFIEIFLMLFKIFFFFLKLVNT